MYIINRDGFTLLAMGFTGKKALQFKIDYINAFNQMEEYIKNQSGQPTLPKRKATGKRVETYLPNEDVLRLQITAYQEGYQSVYHLMQCLVYEFLESPYSSVKEKIKHLEQERNSWKQLCNERDEVAEYYKNDKNYWRDLANQFFQMYKDEVENKLDISGRLLK